MIFASLSGRRCTGSTIGERTVGTGRVAGLLSTALGDVTDSDPPMAMPARRG